MKSCPEIYFEFLLSPFICHGNKIIIAVLKLQLNLCQKISFLNLLTHNMTRDCSLNPLKNRKIQVQNMLSTNNKYCFECQKNQETIFVPVVILYFLGNSMSNLLSYCGLTDARMRASEKDLPVFNKEFQDMFNDKE